MKGLLVVLGLVLAASAWAQPYTLLAEDAAGAWGQVDGTGAGNDIVMAAFAAVDIEVHLDVMPYKRAKSLVMQGLALGCFGMSWAPELSGVVAFPRHELYRNVATLLLRSQDASLYRKTGSLTPGLKVGLVLGYEYPPEVYELIRSRRLVVEEAGTEVQNLKKLAAGRIDLVVANLDDLKRAEDLIRDAGVQGLEVAATLAESKTYLGFSTLNPDTPRAMAAFDLGMDRILANGTLTRILKAWRSKSQN